MTVIAMKVVLSCLIAVLAACGASSQPVPAPSNETLSSQTLVRFAVADRKKQVVRVFAVTDRVWLEREVRVPGRVYRLLWHDGDPVVLLQARRPNDFEVDHEPELDRNPEFARTHDGIVGRITRDAFVRYKALPESTWSGLAIDPGSHGCDYECWTLDVVGRELWQGHCKTTWALHGDIGCQKLHYARIDAPDGNVHRQLPPVPEPPAPLDVKPSPHVKLVFDDGLLHCAYGGSSVTYPVPSYEGEYNGQYMCKYCTVWLSTDPPVFMAERNAEGEYSTFYKLTLFENCQPTERELLARMGDIAVVASDDELVVFRGGRRIGEIKQGGQLVEIERR